MIGGFAGRIGASNMGPIGSGISRFKFYRFYSVIFESCKRFCKNNYCSIFNTLFLYVNMSCHNLEKL